MNPLPPPAPHNSVTAQEARTGAGGGGASEESRP